MGVCSNCNAAVSPGSKICAACGTPQTVQRSAGGYCGTCGTPLIAKYSPCPNCGHVKTTFNPQPNPGNPNPPQYPQQQGALYKSSGTTNLLSILLSLLILSNGVGHLYLGQIGKGIGLLIGGWVLWGAGIATFMFGVGIAFIIGGFILMIYSMVDANKQCKIYNEFVSKNGRAPW